MLLGVPRVLLFWIDGQSDLSIAAQLLTWLGRYERVVQRIVVAYRMPTDVEVAIRSAGAHLYLAADDDIRALVDAWLADWQRSNGRREPALPSLALGSTPVLQAAGEANLHACEPP